jgi:hypothetical protein
VPLTKLPSFAVEPPAVASAAALPAASGASAAQPMVTVDNTAIAPSALTKVFFIKSPQSNLGINLPTLGERFTVHSSKYKK